MNRKAAILAFAVLITAASVAAVGAQSGAPSGDQPTGAQGGKQADPRVEQAFARLGIKYTVNNSGNVVVNYDVADGRSQSVFVMSKTDTYSGVEIREIWSNAGTFDAEPEAAQMADLMTESGKNKIGGWALEKLDTGKYLLFYTIKMPADIPDEAYRMALEFASSVTDAREKELFGGDDN